MIDTETTNGFDDPMFYDCGWQVIDTLGNVYRERSFVNADIFCGEKDLMKEAFFADKIPQYWEEIKDGSRMLASTNGIRKALAEDVRMFGCSFICAHNARFDYKALAKTQRYITKSKYRYFVPFGLVWCDTLKMARQVLGNDEQYREFCELNDYICKNGQLRMTAEIVYRFISDNNDFVEEHTGLADVDIERQILAYCLAKMPDLDRELWGN